MVGKTAVAPRCAAAFAAHRYGFRPGRCCQAAIAEVAVALNNGALGHDGSSLAADIHSAFDQLSHDFRRARIGPRPGRERSKQWLKAGYWAGGTLHHTTAGPPQGGVLSPWWATIALEGLATQLGPGSRVARYGDASLVRAKSLPASEPAGPVVSAFLEERGLALQPEKPRLVQRTEGVDFLGCHVQMRGQTLLSTPQNPQGHARLQAVRSWLNTHRPVSAAGVTRPLNPLLRGWALSFRPVGRKQPCQTVDSHIGRALWRWAKRRPPTPATRWTYRRYVEVGQAGATFYAKSRDRRGKPIRLRLERMPAIPIVRPVQVQGSASPAAPPCRGMGTADAARWVGNAWPQAVGSMAEPQPSGGNGRGVAKPCSMDRRSISIPASRCTPEAGMKARTANGSTHHAIANDTDKASLPVKRRERHAGKLARAVLRGGGDGDTASLPDPPRRSRFRQQLKAGVRLTFRQEWERQRQVLSQ